MATRTGRKTDRESRPRLLKDFLIEDHHSHSKPLPPCKRPTEVPQAATTAISAIHKVMIKMVRLLPFAPIKSPAAGSRGSRVDLRGEGPTTMVRVKDILRWGLVEENDEDFTAPSENNDGHLYYDSPNRCTCTTVSTTAAGSKRSSWCDSDFTAEDIPSCFGDISVVGDEKTEKVGKENLRPPDESVGGGGGHFITEENKMAPQVELGAIEKEQHSPVSVLESPFRELDESFNSHRILTAGGYSTRSYSNEEDSFDEWEVEEKRQAYFRDMEIMAAAAVEEIITSRWPYKFEEERDELYLLLEHQVFNDLLVEEVLVDLFIMH
ncbi:unnamed protein product [Cuscuta europaea]|uniref:DUF4378 domain-containing protein n=1 Tax=Cuscuta europaea TaxID=41803 RepID=A0A9P0ZDS5_CUSEU|nr:unnamed protein product [Cuscuta europaea]